MNSDTCLFGVESGCCTDDKDEHIVQKGLGGTLKSDKVICGVCNARFSSETDPQIAELFRPILELLSPLMSGGLKTKVLTGISKSGAKYRIGAGGVVELTSPLFVPESNGVAAYFPDRMSPEQADARIHADYGIVEKRPAFATIAEIAELLRPSRRLLFDGDVVRAALCDLLELLELASKTGKVPSARIPELQQVRRTVHFGFRDERQAYDMYRFADLERELTALFQPAEFAHRLVVSYSNHLKLLTFTAGFADTLPLHFQMPMTIWPDDFTVRYMKSLVGGADEFEITSTFAWSEYLLKWRPFGTDPGRLRHARLEFFKSHHASRRRALYMLDMKADSSLNDSLRRSIDRGLSGREAIQEVLLSKYAAHPNVPAIACELQQIVPASVEAEELLPTYRSALRMVKDAFGYPEWMAFE